MTHTTKRRDWVAFQADRGPKYCYYAEDHEFDCRESELLFEMWCGDCRIAEALERLIEIDGEEAEPTHDRTKAREAIEFVARSCKERWDGVDMEQWQREERGDGEEAESK